MRFKMGRYKPVAAASRSSGHALFWRVRQPLLVMAALAGTAVPMAAAAAQDAAPQATAPPILAADETDHLRRGLAYYDAGDFANAILEFETVLRRNDLPVTPHLQAELYAEAARRALAGKRFQASGYALVGFGSYNENDTIAGAAQADDLFFSARAGLRANTQLSPDNTLNISLDYRFRAYDDGDRRNDSDLRWDADISHVMGDANIAFGVRGRASYRGNGQTRNDYGVFTEVRFLPNPDNQFSFGAEIRRRNYPQGDLRERSRNIVEFSGGWNRTLFGGKANFSLTAGGGLEVATDDRPDGDSMFVTVSPFLSFNLSDHWGGFVYLWWQNDAYSVERLNTDLADQAAGVASRTDDLLEIGGGLTWELGRAWSLNPEIVWVRDFSNVTFINYSSTELHLTLRKDF
jgi:hypothetical protein